MRNVLNASVVAVVFMSSVLVGNAADNTVRGGIPVRIAITGAPPDSQCINASTDKVWLTLYRIVETKKSGFFTHENQANIVVNVTVQSDPQATKPLTFPLSVTANTRDYGNSGQVSLPIEYTLVSGLSLKQGQGAQAVLYTGFSLDTTLVNVQSANGLGSAISALSSITGSSKIPIPSNPYSQAASYLLGFASTAIQNDITAKNADDKYSTATLALNFSENASCTGGPTGAGFETTGTKALLMEQGNTTDPGYVPIDQTTNYCWAADTTPTFVLKAAKMVPGKPCSDASYSSLFIPVSNDFIAYFLQKQTVSKTMGPNPVLTQQKRDAQKLCDVLGVQNGCPAAK